jgi:hypothetical protein
MAHSFKSTPAKQAFGVFFEPLDASEYIYNKKAKATFCLANKCIPSRTANSQGNLLLLNRANHLKYYACKNAFNKANLNINLITKLDLKDVPVILDVSTNQVPSTINTNAVPFLDYNIDPTGILFGNSICGINNYETFMVYNPGINTNK